MKREEKLSYLKPLETYFLHKWVGEYWWTIIISINPITVLTFETDDDIVAYEIGLLKKFPGLSGELAASKKNMQSYNRTTRIAYQNNIRPKIKID